MCLLPNTDQKGAQEIATQIIEELKHVALPHKYSNVTDYVTMSIGIATSQPNGSSTPETIIRQADSALYAAKKAGKNAYCLYSSAIPLK